MTSETARIWDLMQRAYVGNAWHAPALRELLGNVTAAQAAAHPIPQAPSIAEITAHLAVYEEVAGRRLKGEHIEELPMEQGWPGLPEMSPEAWRRTLARWEEAHCRLREAAWGFPDDRLDEVVAGRDYPYYLLLNGIIQHSLYHAGQVEMLLRAQGVTPHN